MPDTMGDFDRDEADNRVSGAEEPPSTEEVHRSNGADSISSDHRAEEGQAKVFESQGQEEEAMSIGEYYQRKCRERTKSLEKKWREFKLAHKNFKVIVVGRRIMKRKFRRLLRTNCRGKSKNVSFIAIKIWQDEKGKDKIWQDEKGKDKICRYEGRDRKEDEDGADRKEDDDDDDDDDA